MEYDKKSVGQEIRRRRMELGLTQEQAAEKINRALRFYARIELGDVGMSVNSLLSICSMLKTTPDTLLLASVPRESQPEIQWLTEALSNCTEGQRHTAIELVKVYLRSLPE